MTAPPHRSISSGLSPARTRAVLGSVLLIGLAVRLVLAATTGGNPFDLQSLGIARAALEGSSPVRFYAHLPRSAVSRWPYGPGYFPVLVITGAFSDIGGIPFDRLIRVAPTLADLLIALVLFGAVGRRQGRRGALLAATAVALGPTFIINSGFHGQIDSVAVLPALIAVVLWERDVAHRAAWCGLLVGLAALTKTVPGVVLLALLPTARSRREAAELLVAGVGLPVLSVAPFFLAAPAATRAALAYHGLPGVGGLSLLVDPSLGVDWMRRARLVENGSERVLQHVSVGLLVVVIAAVTVVLIRRHTSAAAAASVLMLVVVVAGANFSFGYSVWVLPFLLLQGRALAALVMQLVVFVPTVLLETSGSHPDGYPRWLGEAVFLPLMLAVLAGYAVLLARSGRTGLRAS